MVVRLCCFQRDLLVGSMKFASFETNLGGGWGLLVYPILLFSLPLSGRSPDMTEILLTGTQRIKTYRMPTKLNNFMFKCVYLRRSSDKAYIFPS